MLMRAREHCDARGQAAVDSAPFGCACAQIGCSDLDWARLDSRDAVQLCKSKTRFSDAVQGTYNMQGQVTLDSRFAKCGFKSPRIRGGTCLLEIKIKCSDLRGHKLGAAQTAPDTLCQVFIFNLGSRRWQKEWESDVQMRECSPTYRRVLRVEIPDGGNTHAIVIILDKSRRGSAEIGRAAVNLDQVLDACEQTSMMMPAYVHHLCAPVEESIEAWCNGVIDDADAEASASASGESMGTLILRTERMVDGAHLSVSLRGADPEGLEAETTTHVSTYVPKFQRAVMQMTTFALSLFDQFKILSARGELDDADRHKPHSLDETQFLNLLVYLGILEPPLSAMGDAVRLMALSDLGDRVGKVSRRSAMDIFKRRAQIENSRAPTASKIRRTLHQAQNHSEMDKVQFEACMAAMIRILEDQAARAAQDNPFCAVPHSKHHKAAHRKAVASQPSQESSLGKEESLQDARGQDARGQSNPSNVPTGADSPTARAASPPTHRLGSPARAAATATEAASPISPPGSPYKRAGSPLQGVVASGHNRDLVSPVRQRAASARGGRLAASADVYPPRKEVCACGFCALLPLPSLFSLLCLSSLSSLL